MLPYITRCEKLRAATPVNRTLTSLEYIAGQRPQLASEFLDIATRDLLFTVRAEKVRQLFSHLTNIRLDFIDLYVRWQDLNLRHDCTDR
jgi:hypothetical protein